MPSVSVIIPTHNRRTALEQCLDAVRKQTVLPDEIIVVDDASTDDTSQFLLSVHDECVYIQRLAKNVGVANARNQGAATAKGEWIVFLDDDCIPEPNWLAMLFAGIAAAKPPVDFAWGRTDYAHAGYRGYFPERLVNNQQGKWPGAGNFAIQREVFLKSGGFDSSFLKYMNEDSEFAIRLVSQGFQYLRVPTAIVYHQESEWTTQSLLSTFRNASVWPILKRKYPTYWREFRTNMLGNTILWPMELLILLTFPISIPILFVRYLMHGKRRIGIFFVKYPVLIFTRRVMMWRETIRQGVFML